MQKRVFFTGMYPIGPTRLDRALPPERNGFIRYVAKDEEVFVENLRGKYVFINADGIVKAADDDREDILEAAHNNSYIVHQLH